MKVINSYMLLFAFILFEYSINNANKYSAIEDIRI